MVGGVRAFEGVIWAKRRARWWRGVRTGLSVLSLKLDVFTWRSEVRLAPPRGCNLALDADGVAHAEPRAVQDAHVFGAAEREVESRARDHAALEQRCGHADGPLLIVAPVRVGDRVEGFDPSPQLVHRQVPLAHQHDEQSVRLRLPVLQVALFEVELLPEELVHAAHVVRAAEAGAQRRMRPDRKLAGAVVKGQAREGAAEERGRG